MSMSRSSFAHVSVGSILAGLLALQPQAVAAQRADSPELAPGDIIVTANKRAQKLSDVGATISVATGQDLKTLGIANVDQLAAAVPGFTAAVSQTGAPLFALRGINFNAAQFTAPPAVSVYVNEVPLPYSFMTDGAFLDVDHIEVVKGPQGTLFGENSTGGSINVIPVKPSSTFSLGTEFSINNFGQVQNQSHIGGALTSTLNARLAIAETQFGAWQKPYFLGNRKNGDQNKGAARLLLDWTPTDRLSVFLNLNGSYNHGEQQQSQYRSFSPSVPGAADPRLANYPLPTSPRDADIDPGFDTRLRNRTYQAAARIEYALADDIKLISITNYTDSKVVVPINTDGTAIPVVNTTTTAGDKVFSQEVRITGNTADKKLNYIVGANYENNDLRERLYAPFFDFSGLPPGTVLDNPFKLGARYAGVFGNADYKILPTVTLTAGVRYTKARETRTGCTRDGGNGIAAAVFGGFISDALRAAEGLPPSGAFVPGGCVTIDDTGATPTYLPIDPDRRQNEHNLSWRAGINFQPNPNTLLYALVSRGYKAGVWFVNEIILASADVPVKQEKLTSYEAGTKLSLFNRKLTLNAAGFYYDYANKQFNTLTPSPVGPTFILQNIPKSKAYGLDADFSARLFQGLTVQGGITYLHSRIGPFIGHDHASQPVQFDGSQFSYAPKISATFGAEYRTPLSDQITGFIGANGIYAAHTWADLGEDPVNLIPSYATVDFRAGLESKKGWHGSLWVRNATDKFYITSISPSGDNLAQMAGLPRTFGATVGFDF
jgi:outer membrane receptor protein involved in Fe transport